MGPVSRWVVSVLMADALDNPPCPYCNSTLRYTDPKYQVRCTHCFNHLDGEPDTPIGRMQDLEAPMVISPTTKPRRHVEWGLEASVPPMVIGPTTTKPKS